MVTKWQIENTTVYPLFSLFIQISAIEIRWVFSHPKLMINWLQWLEKKVGCPCSLVSYSHFSTDRAQYQGKSSMFSMCACRSTRYWRHKLCAVRMHNAKRGNDLKLRTETCIPRRNYKLTYHCKFYHRPKIQICTCKCKIPDCWYTQHWYHSYESLWSIRLRLRQN